MKYKNARQKRAVKSEINFDFNDILCEHIDELNQYSTLPETLRAKSFLDLWYNYQVMQNIY